ncbi:MSMEG_0565 family glycosyltransferase [Actinoplanes sp. NBRC 103695]|uniref:MSMEG_0565 family glycosyltransferase n=1 Tax=Actinoplanes sp. NBRC 103695 TaxID=3032202 RepID=UPI0024A21DF8|nr:MSMEG_0565 family glycosyltransferase [Actinoplanes sp. NBRC 103695]GLZ00416.1 glycosyl transferase family 1 [Actinoplanes sp. NBRC 103695]
MRIALLTYSTRPRGGVVHTLALAEALAALGQDVTVWTLARGGGFFRPVDPRVRLSAVPFDEVPGEDVGDRILRSIRVLRAAFDGSAYDIVHAQDCISANAAGRCIRTIHHLDTFTTPALARCHERAIVDPYAHLCVSEAVAAEVRAGWGLSPTVIPNGVDAARFADATPDRRYGRSVLAVGGIEPRKGSLDLLRAFSHLSDIPDLRLVFAGGETLFDYRGYRSEFDELGTRLGVDPLILGPVPHDELPGLVAGAAAFAFPSTKEGFGLAAMEALAAGVPVVVRDLPVLREVFGAAVRYGTDPASLADALRTAIDKPDPARAAAGRALAFSHTWADAARRHLDLYASLG